MAASVCHVISKKVKNHIFRHNRIFRHTFMHKQPILTKQLNYNIFEQIFHSYLRYTDRLSDVLFLLLAVILSELQTKKERLSHIKKYIEVCEGHNFFGRTFFFLCNFLSLFFRLFEYFCKSGNLSAEISFLFLELHYLMFQNMSCDIDVLVFRRNDGKKTHQSVCAFFVFEVA